MTFQVGDIVKLKSGGPNMTVTKAYIMTDSEKIECTWFNGGEVKWSHFYPAMIFKVTKDKKKVSK